MATFLDLITLLATIVVMIILQSALFTGIAWLYHSCMEQTEFGPLDFNRADQESFRKYAGVLVVLIAIPAVTVHVIGYAVRHWWILGRNGFWVALAIMAVLQFAILAFMIPIQFKNLDQKKANILAAANTAAFILLYFIKVGDLIR